jgi:hypothetical protein
VPSPATDNLLVLLSPFVLATWSWSSKTVEEAVPSRKDNIDIIRGMALSAAAAMAEGDAVRTELTEDFANEQIKIRVRIGKRSAVFAVYNADVERVQGDRTVTRKVERLIQDALSDLVR